MSNLTATFARRMAITHGSHGYLVQSLAGPDRWYADLPGALADARWIASTPRGGASFSAQVFRVADEGVRGGLVTQFGVADVVQLRRGRTVGAVAA